MDVWGISRANQSIYHDWWYLFPDDRISKSAMNDGNTTEHGKISAGENGWTVESELGTAKPVPATYCRASTVQADMVWYDTGRNKVLHSGWDEYNERWTDHKRFDGKFIGNPTIFSFSSEDWDFFGAQADNELYHISWKQARLVTQPLNALAAAS